MEKPAHDSLGILVHDAARALRRSFDARATALGLTTAQWRLLVVLFRLGPVTQARLAERLEVEPISVSRLVDRMAEQVAEALGPITIVVNNAGLTDTHRPWQTITEEDWDRVLDVNLKSCYLTLRATYPYMKEAEWGRIINISSVTFHLGMKNLLHYVSSKGGMIGFTRTLARDVGVDGITVNAITPGAIHVESELHVHPDQEALRIRMNEEQSIKRRGLPADIAAAVVFFASPEASFITGQTLNVDGGWAMY